MAKEFIVYSKTKAEFEALVSSGEVDTSQMGIIAETGEMWWNGVYRPLAETVPFANDLTGRIEATPEEFTFRPSAGDKSIRDESALIKKIKGNTIVWNQLVNISNPVRIDFSENTNVYYQILGRFNEGIRITKGHKYIGTGYVETNIETRISFGISDSMREGQIITSFGTGYYERIFDASTDKDSNTLHVNNYSGQKGFLQGDYISCTLNLFDLTQMFGAGNEPLTVEEFKALFPNDYYDYNAGELVSMTSNGLFANGFNQFNGEYAEVLPNNAYYLAGTHTTIGFAEEIGGTLEDITIPTDKLYTPTKKGYIYATGTNININFSHTGVRNGEYEPYWDATKDLSIIQKYFPNGMRSAGSIYDEISFDETTQKWVAIQRVGSVDLGSLAWGKHGTIANTFLVDIYDLFTMNAPIQVRNLLCNKYEVVSRYTQKSASTDKTISANNDGGANRVFVIDSSYTDASSFKTAMSGVMLYYELAEPIITPIEEPIDLSYKVGDFGIEKMLSDSFSAPFKADIIYQFNATDRVRENSMNISKLSKKQTLLESEVDALESKALTTEGQNFSSDQKAQVAENLGGNTNNGLVRYVESAIPVESFAAPNASGVTSKYAFPNASDAVKENANGIIATESFVNTRVLPVSNEIGGLRTSVQSATNTANTAHKEATTAREEIATLDEYTKEEVEKLNADITTLDDDVTEIRGLIGDEYSIWFEPDGQKNTIPTLENYPASNWTTDEDYDNHDRDLYYSISLGRAWRFNYNEGNPIWEEITDAYTVAALEKAQQALDKAQHAVDAVNGLQYIVSAFPEDNVLNTSAVILGKLITVKDGNGNVVAGMYGGGTPKLNSEGYSDGEHGTLMLFAGAETAQTVRNANFRVYENGTVYMNTGVFSGLHKHKTITITNANVNKYFPLSSTDITSSDGTTVTERSLAIESLAAITNFSANFTAYSNISIHLPAIHDFALYDDLGVYTKDELRELVGTTFFIYNNSESFIHLCGYKYNSEDNTFSGPACFGDGIIYSGKFAKVTCVLEVINGKEALYWKYEIGRHNPVTATPSSDI